MPDVHEPRKKTHLTSAMTMALTVTTVLVAGTPPRWAE